VFYWLMDPLSCEDNASEQIIENGAVNRVANKVISPLQHLKYASECCIVSTCLLPMNLLLTVVKLSKL